MARTSIIRQPSPSDDRADSAIESIEEDFTAHSKRRMSNITATSISSFPDSALPSDSESPGAFYAARPRPTFRVGSLRRSPLPDRLSPRPQRSPRRPRSRDEEVAVTETPPLVLLHVTILPPGLPWRRDVLDTFLPEELKNRFGVLRAQTAGLIRQRGILIAHPQDEFEVLVERVLEALGLLPERIGLDGQFRSRTPSTLAEEDEEEQEREEEFKPCEQCQRVHGKEEGAGWQVKVFAANGLMRAGAWSAAWSEMERVDVEVVPCISDEVRKCLDDAQAAEDMEPHEETDYRNHGIVIHTTAPQEPHTTEPQHGYEQPQIRTLPQPKEEVPLLQTSPQKLRRDTHDTDSLPQVYRPKEIPLNILLRNYLYLLLRDRRNVAIAFLVLTMLASTWFGVLRPVNGLNVEELGHGNFRVVGDMLPGQVIEHDSWTMQGRGENAVSGVVTAMTATADKEPEHTAAGPVKSVHQAEDSKWMSTANSFAASPETDANPLSDQIGHTHTAQVSPNPNFVLGLRHQNTRLHE